MFNLYSLAVQRVSGFAIGLCGALLIALAVEAVPTFGHAPPAAAVAASH
ncbi:hypothetical protein [Brevundimonas bullata]|jgi:hypothetical protein